MCGMDPKDLENTPLKKPLLSLSAHTICNLFLPNRFHWCSTVTTPRPSSSSTLTTTKASCCRRCRAFATGEGTQRQVRPDGEAKHRETPLAASSQDKLGSKSQQPARSPSSVAGVSLKHVYEKVFTSDSGMRRNVPKVLVVVTDGRSQDDVKKTAEKLQHSGIHQRNQQSLSVHGPSAPIDLAQRQKHILSSPYFFFSFSHQNGRASARACG